MAPADERTFRNSELGGEPPLRVPFWNHHAALVGPRMKSPTVSISQGQGIFNQGFDGRSGQRLSAAQEHKSLACSTANNSPT
jgi:hypothetical protein